jgi:polysaccharide biosynthesis transport protein
MTTQDQASSLRDYLQVIRRRKWIIVVSAIVLPLAALAFSLQQSAMYESSSQVLLSQQDIGSQLTGVQSVLGVDGVYGSDTADQAQVARSPNVVVRVIRALHLTTTTPAFLAGSSVTTGLNSNILTFHVSNHDPKLASAMASAYADAYVQYRLAVDTAGIEAARQDLGKRIATAPAGAVRTSLLEKDQTLEEMLALNTADASVIRQAGTATQIAPRTKRNVALGLVLGIFLGAGLAFLREALDTRIRSAEEISTRLGLPLLARLPEPSRKLQNENGLVMLEEPTGTQSEAFRMLRTNLEFVTVGKDARVIMVTSAVEKEGKSTTIANLAVAMARAGQRVVLVDLDLRKPFLDRFFNLRAGPGLTQVVLGHVSLREAVVSVPLLSGGKPGGAPASNGNSVKVMGNGHGSMLPQGSLHLLASGPIPPDPGEFVGTEKLGEILAELRRVADVVLVDAPPLFHVGDGLVLSAKVDAIVVVTRMEIVRRPMLNELKRLLESSPTLKLGFAVTGAEAEEGYGNGYGGYYYYRSYERAEEDSVRS